MDIEQIKLIVDLTMAKVEILKLKADSYTWSYVDVETKATLEKTLVSIDSQLSALHQPNPALLEDK